MKPKNSPIRNSDTPTATIGSLIPTVIAIAAALTLGEAVRTVAGDVGFLCAYCGSLLVFAICPPPPRWRDWRRGYTRAERDSMLVKYARWQRECLDPHRARRPHLQFTQGEWRAFQEMSRVEQISVYHAVVSK